MTTPSLAKIERVDLREAWPNEARDFTPWLAANITELGEALGMDLELQEIEASVGGYSLDVLATDPNQNRPVIIENQLEATNHDHLGKLLTYAAGYDANVVVWLTREFRDEHRQALDWLNQRTGEDTQFFGVVVELWRIGNSPYAPHFKTVATPNEWGKKTAAKSRATGEARETAIRITQYREFFCSLIDNLPQNHGFASLPSVGKKNSLDFPSGQSGIKYTAIFRPNQEVEVVVHFAPSHRAQNMELLKKLKERKDEIELAMEHSLNWHGIEGYASETNPIAISRHGSIEDDSETLEDIRDWIVDNLLKFKRVFGPRLAELVER